MTQVPIIAGCCPDTQIKTTDSTDNRYRVQVGIYRNYNRAMDFQMNLMENGIVTDIDRQGELFTVNFGEFSELDRAVRMERYLRCMGYNTMVTVL